MRNVVVCGLYDYDYSDYPCVEELATLGNEFWVINDWYQFIPYIPAAQVWNIHDAPHIHTDTVNRFTWGWAKWYNIAARKGAEIVVRDKIEDVYPEAQRIFDDKLLQSEFPDYCLGCQISIMICQAALEKADSITLIGARFNEQEYEYQIASVLMAVLKARERGIKVTIKPDGRECEMMVRTMAMGGELHTIKPYWMRRIK